MFKKIIFLLLAAIMGENFIFAQDSKKLISIETGDRVISKEIELLELPVLHYFGDELITKVNDEQIEWLLDRNIKLKILDKHYFPGSYYLISNQANGEIKTKSNYGELLYNAGSSILVKGLVLNERSLIKDGLVAVQLSDRNKLHSSQTKLYNPIANSDLDSLIGLINSSISEDTVEYFIQSLQDFGTRYALASNRDSVANWLKQQFEIRGFTDVEIDSFWYAGTWQKNVVATLNSTQNPDAVIVIGGHHDSITGLNPNVYAPGADDNGSGTAAVLEIARVLMLNNFESNLTIKFVTFAAEELGLIGSDDYAQKAVNSGMNIVLMINHDMISHNTRPLSSRTCDINYYTGSEDFRELALYSVNKYTDIDAVIGSGNSGGSDSYSFWSRDFPAVYFEESQFSPYWHTEQDIIRNYDMAYCTEVIKGSCATLVTVTVVPIPVENLNVIQVGNGSSLYLSWSSVPGNDIEGYKIYVGLSSGNYYTNFITPDTTYLIDGLTEGTPYYIGVASYDTDGFESLIREEFATPYSIPLSPSGILDSPQMFEIGLSWYPNNELDLLGYNVYRGLDSNGTYSKLNSTVLLDTSFTDSTPQSAIYYYYQVRAIDSLQNESTDNMIVRSRAVSLDQGILIVDETLDGTGLLLSPTDQQVDDFYRALLVNYDFEEYDIIAEGDIKLADLGAYSTIIWHGDDNNNMYITFSRQEDIKRYLEFGGNFLFSGYQPSKAFENNLTYPISFTNGNFLYDYFMIDYVEKVFGSRFIGAEASQPGYMDIYMDTTKTTSITNYHLRNIESISSAVSGIEIYIYDSNYDPTTQGGMKGLPVGVEFIGLDYKTVVLSFPLYYMHTGEAKNLVEFILNNKFNEQTGVEENIKEVPVDYFLSHNYPNPFNPNTIINYSIPKLSFVTLKVFDVLGNEITVLVNEEKPVGNYEIEFDASNLSSGVYFYRLQAGDYIDTKKMVLLR